MTARILERYSACFSILRTDGQKMKRSDILTIGASCVDDCKLEQFCRKPSISVPSVGIQVVPLPAIKEKGLVAWEAKMWEMYLQVAACLESGVYVLQR